MNSPNDRHTSVLKPTTGTPSSLPRLLTLAAVTIPMVAVALAGAYLFLTGAQDPDPRPQATVEQQPSAGQTRAGKKAAPQPQAPHRVDTLEIENEHKTQTWERAREPAELDPRREKRIENATTRTPVSRDEPPASTDEPLDAPTPRFEPDHDNTALPNTPHKTNGRTQTPDRSEMPEGTWPRGAMATLPSVLPPIPWQPLKTSKALTRIGVGSCLSQSLPQPIWDDVLALTPRPGLFLMIGDNVYGDIKSRDGRELITAYRTQGRHPDFERARAAFPFLAMWDDHDFGANDAGAEFAHKVATAKLFADFWQIDTGRPAREGIYYARMIGPPGRRVHIIMLDTRTFRSNLTTAKEPLPHWGRYQPDTDATATMLGPSQSAWLEAQLKRQADLRLIVSSVQVLAGGHGFERWGNLPHARDALLAQLNTSNPVPTMLLSGDRHFGAIYEVPLSNGGLLPEITASSMNRSYGPSQDVRGPELASDFFHRENFALIDIDWQAQEVKLSLRGLGGEIFHVTNYAFSRLNQNNSVTGPRSGP